MTKRRSRKLEAYIEGLAEAVAYFSPQNKTTRELWVIRAYLMNAGVPFRNEEVEGSKVEPPDVLFRGARFEVKEVLDPGRRRHAEFKAELERARSATTMKGLLSMFTPVDVTLEDIYSRCLTEVRKLSKKYPSSVRSSLDLIFYVNLQHVMEVSEEPFPDTSELSSHRWRSVSFVKGNRACCLYARHDAPPYIAVMVGKVCHRV
ncbi:DUF1780 domain-containing protein [Hydrocarboniphaga sp.]|uniref:DUF1780 domain-containing protein n=1 Tax=Hydrocarboniphaga sp. TaxID=2033016 RepID=UPI00261E582D|nr:DUF1780 domain-containing protein [Hydrocarboniphaga sp.]